MTLKSVSLENLSNEDLGRLILELHECVEKTMSATNLRIDGIERQMAQNARSAIEIFVTRAEIEEKLTIAAEDRAQIKTALGLHEGKEPKAHTALTILSRMTPWRMFGALGSIVIILKVIDSAVPGLLATGRAVWHAVIG